MSSSFAAALAARTLVLDGGMGSQILSRDLSIDSDYCGCENCTDILCTTRPDVVQDIHESYLRAGADAVETNSFGANKLVLGEFDRTEDTYDIAKCSAEIARAACDIHGTKDKPRFVLGSMGPGTKLISLGQTDWDSMFDSYREGARGLIDGGADTLLIETCQDILQIKCSINACLAALKEKGKSHEDVPIMVSLTIEQTGTTLTGSSIEAAAVAISRYPILSLGLNCATGPAEMVDHMRWLGKHWDRALTCYPNAGLPALVEGRTEYPLQPGPMAEILDRFVNEFGVRMIGGCCGTTPEHITELCQVADKANSNSQASRTIEPIAPSSTSLYSQVEHRQDASILIIGERCNASGSRRFKQLLEVEDWDGIVAVAREQVHEGSHVLDVNVDYAGRDGARDMGEVVSRLVRQVDAPLMIDSTQTATLEAGLRHAPGKCIINSANFEDGDTKFDDICQLAVKYAASIVIGTIDEDQEAAMARTADRKFAIAKRAIERAQDIHGIPQSDLFIDPLVLPISTGMDADRRSALELIEGTRRITAAFPDVQITCGLSNVSFGLKPSARVALNSVFMHELAVAGMSSAIVHAGRIIPLVRIDGEQKRVAAHLIYDRRSNALGGTGLPSEYPDALESSMVSVA